MYKLKKQVSEFSVEGQILGLGIKEGKKLKYLQIGTPVGAEYVIKVPKELRSVLAPLLMLGLVVRVTGQKTLNLETGTIKLKASSVIPSVDKSLSVEDNVSIENSQWQAMSLPLFCSSQATCPTHQSGDCQAISPSQTAAKAPIKILVCQKSDCQKRGGKAVCQALEATLSDRGLTDRVVVQGTGCLKQCKAGPNLVLMPDKKRYSRIEPADIPALIDKHFATVDS